jgi:Sulfotransferase family
VSPPRPRPPRGRLPNFFLAGVAKAGTTSLHAYLAQHPQIYMSPIKEPWFFGVADLLAPPYGDDVRRTLERDRAWLAEYLAGPQAPGMGRYVMEWADYVRLFRDATDEAVIGEASTGYFWLASAAGAIRARLPDARFAFVLRDPADRLFTLYLLNRAREPRLAFRAWFQATLQTPHLWPSIVGAGRYATHLERWFGVWPRERMRVYLYDDYCADPRSLLRDLFAFLGVRADYPVDLSRRLHETAPVRFPTLHALRQRLLGETPALRWLPDATRRPLRRLYRRRRRGMRMDPGDRRLVIDYYRDEILRAADLLGRDLSTWLR